MNLGMPLGLIGSAVFERSLSSDKQTRVAAAKLFPRTVRKSDLPRKTLLDHTFASLYASKLVSYAQGFSVLQKASDEFNWNLDMGSIARMWRGGCIIRSVFLNDIASAYEADEKPRQLLLAPYFAKEIGQLLNGWKSLVANAAIECVPVPAFSSALNYFYSLTSENLPANMIQAQRDFFGAHTFERKDQERGKFFHEDWTGHGGATQSGTYNV